MEEPYKYTPKTPEKKAGFFGRMKKGFKRVGELKEKWDESKLQSAEKRITRQERYAQVYEAEAKMYGAAARKEKARQQFSQSRMGSFGGQQQRPFPIDMGLRQAAQPTQRVKVAYRSKPKGKRTKTRIRYAQQPQKSMDDQIVEFMRR